MGTITIDFYEDDVRKVMRLSQPEGTGGGWFVMVNNFYLGTLLKQQGEWRFTTSRLESHDITILIDLIDKHEGLQGNDGG